MDDDEIVVFIISALIAVCSFAVTSTGRLHALFLRGNPGPGLLRLAVLASMGWIGFVIWRYADPSVTGIYISFYLVMGYAAVKLFGQFGANLFGMRFQVDVYERKNLAAAVFVASFILGTGMIFGGSLWGEADPTGDEEGGWWIPLGFFLLGWGTMAATLGLFLWREPGSFRANMRQNRNLEDAQATAMYTLCTAVLLTEAVAGDFFGWLHGLLSFGGIALLLFFHELLAPRLPSVPMMKGAKTYAGRLTEGLVYLGLALLIWVTYRMVDIFVEGATR